MISDQYFLQIKKYISAHTGIIYYEDKDRDLINIVQKRMQKTGVSSYIDYMQLLMCTTTEKLEFDELISDLTIGETYFFRNAAIFDGLRKHILPEIIKKNHKSRKIHIWSAGCATGEEAYSLSILMKHEFPQLFDTWDISITGTDINRKFLAHALKGEYGDWSFRETSDIVKKECFLKKGNTWRIKPEYTAITTFKFHNLVMNPFPSLFHNLLDFDIIFCRNVMIYFTETVILDLIKKFRNSLVEGGWLIVGHADHNVKYFKNFETVSFPDTSFYYKTDVKKEVSPYINTAEEPVKREPLLAEDKYQTPAGEIENAPLYLDEKDDSLQHLPDVQTEIKEDISEFSEMEHLYFLANNGRWSEALIFCRDLVGRNSLDPVIHFYKALILGHLGQQDDSELSLRQSIYLDRNFVLSHYYLGLLFQKKRDYALADKAFNNVIAILEKYDDHHVFDIADRITAGQLKKLTLSHMEVLRIV